MLRLRKWSYQAVLQKQLFGLPHATPPLRKVNLTIFKRFGVFWEGHATNIGYNIFSTYNKKRNFQLETL